MRKTFEGFGLTVEAGCFRTSQIVVLMGENGTGKTTFIRLLAGKLNSDIEGVHQACFNQLDAFRKAAFQKRRVPT